MKLPLRLYVSGAFGNIATFFGAFAECVPVGLHGTRANYEPLRSSQSPLQRFEVPWSGRKLPVNPWQARVAALMAGMGRKQTVGYGWKANARHISR